MTFDSKIQARCAQARPFFGTFKDSGPGHCMVLKTEDPDRFEKLLASLIEEFQPRTPTERHFVETMAVCHWRLVRNGTLQITLLKMTDSSNLGTLQLLQHEKKALKRQYCRARRTFLDLRSSKNQCFAI